MSQYRCELCGKIFTKKEKFLSGKILCRSCKLKEYYKGHPGDFQKRLEKSKETLRWRYGVENPSRIEGVKEKISKKLKNFYSEENNKKKALDKKEKTNLERFGVKYPALDPAIVQKGCETQLKNNGFIGWQNKDLQRHSEVLAHSSDANIKRRNSWLKNWGTDHPSKNEDIKKKKVDTYKKKTGYDHPQHNPDIVHSCKGYLYKGVHFDSSWELAYYIWLIDNSKKFIYHPCIFLEYTDEENKEHKYQPDFLVEGVFYEIKGDQFFDENGNPFNQYTKKCWARKYKALLENRITILREADMRKYLKYIKDTYGKNYLKQFRASKLKESSTTIETTSKMEGSRVESSDSKCLQTCKNQV